jgi:hypothetical protein
MKKIKEVYTEDDINSLVPGDWVFINNKPAMRRGNNADGARYDLPNGDGTVTVITNLRGYYTCAGAIIPVWYSTRKVKLKQQDTGVAA